MKLLKKVANAFFYLMLHPIEALLGVVVVGLVALFGYGFIQFTKSANHQTLIDPRISSYYVTAEIISVKQNNSGETVLEYKVVETNTYEIRVGGTGEMIPIKSQINEVQMDDISQVGALLTITCNHQQEQMYCKMKTENFETEYIPIKYK